MLNFIGEKIPKLLCKAVCAVFSIGGHVPKSVAIIMDGNRRYANKKKFEKIKGHEEGLSILLNVCLWCIELGIKDLTVFAFSIDNFNRPKEEVEALLTLAREKFAKLSEKNQYMNKYGVKVCFYGNLDFLDDGSNSEFSLKHDFIKMEKDTEFNDKLKLNICFPYNSTEEIVRSVKLVNAEIKKETSFEIESEKEEKNYKEEDYKGKLESHLYGGYNCNPDILIRTSGEIRLSNFLLYQCRYSMLFFVDLYWPEFTFKEFTKIIIRYNINYKTHLRKLKELEIK